jgi:hypothetical protein
MILYSYTMDSTPKGHLDLSSRLQGIWPIREGADFFVASKRLRHVPQAAPAGLLGCYSTPIMTLEALITAKASLPSANARDCTDVLVMMETTSTPGATSRVISQFTAPWTILVTVPLSIFRALSFITQVT